MAKTRGGLGRGLGSLLGGGPEGAYADDQVAVSGAEGVSRTADSEGQADKQTESRSEIYSNRDDQVKIKEVVEREVPVQETAKQNDLDGEVDIDLVEPNPDQPRTNFKKEDLEELAESIQKNGLLQPILVRELGGKYQIIAGERRWQASKSIGLAKVPVHIVEADDDKTIVLALVENIQRSDLNPIEEAYGYKRMMERGKMTQSEVAQAVSKGRTTITNTLRLLELPEDAQQLLYEDKITAGHARAILSIPTKEGRRKLIDKLVEDSISVRDAEKLARSISGKAPAQPKERPSAPKSYKTVARAMSDSLGTEVKIKSVKGANKIEIAFKDEAELQRLFRRITND